jgi:hypothetical protein
MTPPKFSNRPSGAPDPDDSPLGHAIHAALDYDTGPRNALNFDDRAIVDELVPWLRTLAGSTDTGPTGQPAPAFSDPATATGDADDTDPAAAPAAEDDSLALTLGLVADPTRRVAAARLRRARQAAGLKPSAVARYLSARGWSISTDEVSGWELRDTALRPAVAADVAVLLGVKPDTLIAAGTGSESDWQELLEDPGVQDALAALAASAASTVPEVIGRLHRTLAGAEHRNKGPLTVDAFLGVLDVLRRHPDLLPPP